ncbi:AMP-binding protein [Mariniphaga sp.]|uniref:AMP-binding protein n=1 Tax=Mariniphaga sp. TaxID=1954475 RepID=UPI00356A55E3
MNLFPKYIKLFGAKVLVEEFIQKPNKPIHEKELAGFLKEWYAPEDFVEVKTSGSTGTPKTIRLKKEFVATSAQRTIHFFQLKKDDRVLHCLPLKYIAGKLMVVRAMLGELDLRLIEPSSDFSYLQTEKFRFAAMVPNQVAKILKAEAILGKWLGNIEKLLIGGSAITYSLEKQLQNLKTDCYSSYGMTETATHIALRKMNGHGAVGWYRCLENISVSLSDNGCLQIYIPGLESQPLQTTDLAELKDDKTFRILGRSDNVIISGGIKFSPEQIEKKLESFISTPFLISSLRHEPLGEQLVLVVEGKKSDLEIKRLMKICRSELNKYEQPRQIRFLRQLPRTANGKFNRKGVAEVVLL